jgi:hypothetical protein
MSAVDEASGRMALIGFSDLMSRAEIRLSALVACDWQRTQCELPVGLDLGKGLQLALALA